MSTRKYQQRRRAESAEATRRRVLDAVHERLQVAPTEPLSMDAVAKAAQVARSTIYLVFGSRAGLFDAFTTDLMERSGFDRLVAAVANPDAGEHLRGAFRAGHELYAPERDVLRVLVSMSAIDADMVGGAVVRIDAERRGGLTYLATRLAEQGLLREGLTVDETVDILFVLTSFEAFDLLVTGRGLAVDVAIERLLDIVERALLRPPRTRRGPTR